MPSLEGLHRRDSYFVRHVRYFISLYTTRFGCVALHVHTWERVHRIQVKLLQTILSILLLDSASHILVAQGGRCWKCNNISVNCTVFMHHRIWCFFHLVIFLTFPNTWNECSLVDDGSTPCVNVLWFLWFVFHCWWTSPCNLWTRLQASGRGTATGCLPWLPISHPEQNA